MEWISVFPSLTALSAVYAVERDWDALQYLTEQREYRIACHFLSRESVNSRVRFRLFIALVFSPMGPTVEFGTLPIWISAALIVLAFLLQFVLVEPGIKKAIALSAENSEDLPKALEAWLRMPRWRDTCIICACALNVWNLCATLRASAQSAGI